MNFHIPNWIDKLDCLFVAFLVIIRSIPLTLRVSRSTSEIEFDFKILRYAWIQFHPWTSWSNCFLDKPMIWNIWLNCMIRLSRSIWTKLARTSRTVGTGPNRYDLKSKPGWLNPVLSGFWPDPDGLSLPKSTNPSRSGSKMSRLKVLVLRTCSVRAHVTASLAACIVATRPFTTRVGSACGHPKLGVRAAYLEVQNKLLFSRFILNWILDLLV